MMEHLEENGEMEHHEENGENGEFLVIRYRYLLSEMIDVIEEFPNHEMMKDHEETEME
jgi:predicted alpha-1,6-mannanase (GH76 family)